MITFQLRDYVNLNTIQKTVETLPRQYQNVYKQFIRLPIDVAREIFPQLNPLLGTYDTLCTKFEWLQPVITDIQQLNKTDQLPSYLESFFILLYTHCWMLDSDRFDLALQEYKYNTSSDSLKEDRIIVHERMKKQLSINHNFKQLNPILTIYPETSSTKLLKEYHQQLLN